MTQISLPVLLTATEPNPGWVLSEQPPLRAGLRRPLAGVGENENGAVLRKLFYRQVAMRASAKNLSGEDRGWKMAQNQHQPLRRDKSTASGACRCSVEPAARLDSALPDKRDQPEAGALTVFGIAGQVPAENFFLAPQAENEDGEDEETDRHHHERTKGQRGAEPDDEGT